MKARFFILFCLIVQFAFGQEEYPQDYFDKPMDIPLFLAGNFGEIRANHFHTGLDLKTEQRTGIDVNAAAEGYVSRINISLYGYGNALYVTHPNGFTTVYAHLEEFSPKIKEYVHKKRYAAEKNTIELFPKKGELSIDRGEVIAKSGESGGAAGPHLHYEIRDDQERPINPLLFGVKIKDTRPPTINNLYVYPISHDAHVDKSAKMQKLHLQKQKDGSYTTEEIKAYGKLGFGIDALDYMDGSANTNNFYKINTALNGENQMEIKFNRISFANTRYINRYIDYAQLKKNKFTIQKLFLEPNNNVDMQIDAPEDGYIKISGDLDYQFEILLKDFAGNETKIKVPIKSTKAKEGEITQEETEETDYLAHWNKPNVFNFDKHDVYIPKNALYEDTYLELEEKGGSIEVHDYRTPLHSNITIGFDVSKYSTEEQEKLYVTRVYPWGAKHYSNTYKEPDRITTKTTIFGTYKLERDDTPPVITPLNIRDNKWMSKADYIKVKIADEESGIDSYRGTINGNFIALDYDYKTGTLQYNFSDKVPLETENKLKIIVVDNVGNSSTYETTFFRKE